MDFNYACIWVGVVYLKTMNDKFYQTDETIADKEKYKNQQTNEEQRKVRTGTRKYKDLKGWKAALSLSKFLTPLYPITRKSRSSKMSHLFL